MAKNNNKLGTGLGIAAAVAAAAASVYYFYTSDEAAKHRKQVKSWVVKAKGDVLERLENMKEVTKDGYENAVKEVMGHYQKVKHVPAQELTKLSKELRGHWKAIAASLEKKGPTRKKAAVKSPRKK